jgi:chromosome partitioning protein
MRKRQQLSCQAVAERAGLGGESAVRRIESAEINPTLDTLDKYAKAINSKLKLEVEKMKAITVFNHAGGVGKSSSVRDIGFVMADNGLRVLLIDADPQANLTYWLGVRDEIFLEQTIFKAVLGDDPSNPSLELPSPIRVHNMDLVPACLEMFLIDSQLVGHPFGATRLRKAVSALDDYDVVIIDPPPSLGQLSTLSVIAADHIVVPMPTNSKAIQNLRTVVDMVKQISKDVPNLAISQFLITQFDQRTRHDKDSLALLQETLADLAPLSSPLSARPAVYKDAQLAGEPISVFAPGSPADVEVRKAASELLAILEMKVKVDA